MQTQYVLGYTIDSHFHDHKLAKEIDEKKTATEILTTYKKIKSNRTRPWF